MQTSARIITVLVMYRFCLSSIVSLLKAVKYEDKQI